MMENNSDKQLENYAEVFDFYIDRGFLPEQYQEDVLGNYIKEILDEPSNNSLCHNDETWRDILKTSTLEFFGNLLPYFNTVDEEAQKEIQLINMFTTASIEDKRKMWTEVEEHICRTYTSAQINIDSYLHLFQQSDRNAEDILQTLAHDWEKVAKNHFEDIKKNMLNRHKRTFERWAVQAGKFDYETVGKTASDVYKYPALKEILHVIGRGKEKDMQEQDATTTRYIPVLLSHNPSHEEIEGICSGNDLSLVLPTEIALLSEKRTESVFYQKHVSKQLLLFSNQPPYTQKKKIINETHRQPRLTEGPIIVCIDTSSSMSGEPEQIAKSLLFQILQTAKRKKRKCFLITYAVRCRTLEISKPQHWREFREFMKKEFTGGTDGEMMFASVFQALDTETYSMADILLISDFCFPYPHPQTEKSIREEQQKGTRFYGLRIQSSGTNTQYDKLFDRIWKI